MLGVEVVVLKERYVSTRTKLSGYHSGTTWNGSTSLSALHRGAASPGRANPAFATEAANLLLPEPPSEGKTHQVVALALKAIENVPGAYFARAYDPMKDLGKPRIQHNLTRG